MKNQMTCICAIILFFGLKRENARRDAKYGEIIDPDTPSLTSAENAGDEKSGSALATRGRVSSWQQDLEDREYLERWGLTGMTKEQIIDLGDDHPSFRFMY
jgi:hypothetical protein